MYINITENLLLSNNAIQIENCLFSNNVGNKKYSIDILLFYGLVKHISISDCNFYNNSNLNSIEQRLRISSVFIPQEIMLLANIYISNTNFSLNSNSFVIYLWTAKLHLQGPIIIHNNTCSACVMTLDKSKVFLTNYIEFSANKAPNFITHYNEIYYCIMLMDNTTFNVSYNSFTNFAYPPPSTSKLLTTPSCYFQYFSARQLDNHHGNYSIIFNKNIEMHTQSAYNNLRIVHCNWLPQSAYKTAIPPVVNKQYIQFINASGNFFNKLPQ